MDEEETSEGVPSAESPRKNVCSAEYFMETEDHNISTFPENTKKSENPVLMFGSALKSNNKVVKSAIFEFGNIPCAVPEKEPSTHSVFDSPDSTDDIDLFNAQIGVQSAIKLVDKSLRENEAQDKCISNECESNRYEGIHEMSVDSCKTGSTAENKEKMSITQCQLSFKPQQIQNDASECVLKDEINQCVESGSKGSEELVIGNNTDINTCKTSVCKSTVERNMIIETSLETKESISKNEEIKRKYFNVNVHGCISSEGNETIQNGSRSNEETIKHNIENGVSVTMNEKDCSLDNLECSKSDLVNEKMNVETDQYMECSSGIECIEDRYITLLDEIHVDGKLEDPINITDEISDGNSKSSVCSNQSYRRLTKISNEGIQTIKDGEFGSTLSVTLEDVEVSVFEEDYTDKVSLYLKPTKSIEENNFLVNNSAVKTDSEEKLKLNDNFAGSHKKMSQCNAESTFKLSDLFLDDKKLNESNRDPRVNERKKLEIAAVVTKYFDQKQKTFSIDEYEDINKEEPFLTLRENSIHDNEDQNIISKEIIPKTCIEKDISLGTTNIEPMEVENESIDSDNNCKPTDTVTENNYSRPSPISIEENEKQCSEATAESGVGLPISINDIDSNESLFDLENVIQSAINKNNDFRNLISSETMDTATCKENNAKESSDIKESNEAEVICLFDDDDDEFYSKKKKPAAALKCVNPNCMSGEGLDKPAMFVLSYFRLKRTKDQLVCEECFNMVTEHQEKLATMLKAGKPLFSADFPSQKDVILLDSDEESISDDESNLSDDTMEMIQNNLDDVIAESLGKFGLDHQIRESCHVLDSKIETMEDEAKELDKSFDQVQKTLDEFRKQIYENFDHPTKEIEELHFTDCEIPPMPILRNKVQNQLYNMELMSSLRKTQREQADINASQRYSSPGHSRTIAMKKVTQVSHSTIQHDIMTQDVIALHSETRSDPPPSLPPLGPLRRPKLRVGDLVYTMKVSYFSIWVQARVIEIIPRNPTENDPSTEAYRVRIENLKKNTVRTVTGTYLAYEKPASTQLKVGTRVIAIFKEEDELASDRENYYVGVIAEPPKSMNKYRYLVFFDDGYTQYCPHENILVVCNTSKNVWEDIHPEPRDFIRNYLQQYPERPMVKLSQGQVVRVEWNGRWWIVRVLEVDASLVKVHFDADKRTEWIYRGSTRLGPMFQELAAAKERQSGSLLRSRGFCASSKSDMPYVEYTRGDGDEKKDEQEEEPQPIVPTRSVARKSTAKKPPELVISNPVYAKPLVNQLPSGKLSERTLNPLYKPRKFYPHQCSKSCIEWTNYSLSATKLYDPLITPLMFGFGRMNMMFQRKNLIMYKAPCGRTIRSHQEMLCYLQCTKSPLTIDLFDFDFWVNPLNIFEEGKTFGRIEDLSYGKENVPISCVNELDHSMPQYVQYMTARQPANDVNLNLDPEFLVGCDCTDDCEDRSKCSCWQLTMQGKAYVPDGELDPLFGYQYRRLPERIATGIYECNSKCKCSSTCLNKVAQQPLAFRLQLFKTFKKGWGIRCLHDIPRGAFICIYAGFLLTEAEANEGGKAYGDEYLAELDYIESVEGLKEGYESEARDMSDAEDNSDENVEIMDIEYDQEQTLDSEGETENISKRRQEDIRLRLRRRAMDDSDKDSARKSKQDDDSISISDDEISPDAYYYTVTPFSEKVRRPQTFNATIKDNEERESMYPSVRDLYGQDEQVYIMDAKTHGNIGRYLNHSCSPNVFVQNVFVDTHDLRFPWVAFFANQYVPAGTELTWDYNYDVGSVPGKVMLCYCGSPNCRGRLL